MTRPFTPHPNRRIPGGNSGQRTVITLAVLALVWTISLVPGLAFVWGLVFAGWALLGLWSGEVYLVGAHRRDTEPILFWLVGGTWLLLGLAWVIAPPT